MEGGAPEGKSDEGARTCAWAWACQACTMVNTPFECAPFVRAGYEAFRQAAQHSGRVVAAVIGPLLFCAACDSPRCWTCACGADNLLVLDDAADNSCVNATCSACGRFALSEWCCPACGMLHEKKSTSRCVTCKLDASYFALYQLTAAPEVTLYPSRDTTPNVDDVWGESAATVPPAASRPPPPLPLSLPRPLPPSLPLPPSPILSFSPILPLTGDVAPLASLPAFAPQGITASQARAGCAHLGTAFRGWRSMARDGNQVFRAVCVSLLSELLQEGDTAGLLALRQLLEPLCVGREMMVVDVMSGLGSRASSSSSSPHADVWLYFADNVALDWDAVSLCRKAVLAWMLRHHPHIPDLPDMLAMGASPTPLVLNGLANTVGVTIVMYDVLDVAASPSVYTPDGDCTHTV